MNKNALKTFAIWARVQLMEAVKLKAYEYGIDENGYGDERATVLNGRALSNAEAEQRAELVAQIKRKGFNQVVEEVAYTWFNRFIALRYMEVNGYLPTRIRVFSNENGAFDPEILKQATSIELEGIDKNTIYDFIDKQDNEGLFKYLVIAQCNSLNHNLPGMFEKINNYTELLFPNKLLADGSVAEQMVSTIPEDDWKDQVQIIGWLYQFYNSELKDETYAQLAKKVKLTKEKIPAVTQLFTPDWIVRYMVENSLGRLWYEGHPDDSMKAEWKYYLDEAEQEPEVQKQLDEIKKKYSSIKPEEIKIIDPCMGSGHILVYAFDVLMQIYLSQGWNERDAAKSIIENNLYGIDIDDRAYQLAYFAVMMKARSYSRRILNQKANCNLSAIVETNDFNEDYLELFGLLKGVAKNLVDEFYNAKEYGSILNVKTPLAHLRSLEEKLNEIENEVYDNFYDSIRQSGLITVFKPILKQAFLLAQKYDAVITNPPYMSPSPVQKPFVEKNYPDSKGDLFAVFIEKCQSLTDKNKFYAMITMQSWMFLSSFEKLRAKMMLTDTINMAHLGARAFDEIGGEVVQTAAFVRRSSKIENYSGIYYRLVEQKSETGKQNTFLKHKNKYIANQNNFKKITGKPIAYWVSNSFINLFSEKQLGELCYVKKGMSTANDDAFLRQWQEVSQTNVGTKWFKITKGGEFRKWYGNRSFYVNWEDDGRDLRNFEKSVLRNIQYYFKESICWNYISASRPLAFKYYDGFAYTAAAPCVQSNNHLLYAMGFGNSTVASHIIMLIGGATLTYEIGEVAKLPYIIDSNNIDNVEKIVDKNIQISQTDWDSFETSWDFKKHPLI